MEELPGPLITDQQNFSVETNQEPDYVSTATNIFCAPKECFSHLPLCYGVFPPPAGDKMFWLAVLTVGKNGMAASGYDGRVADRGQAVVWPQGVRVPGAQAANK